MELISYQEMGKLIEQYYRLSGEYPSAMRTAGLVRDFQRLRDMVAALKQKVREGGQIPMPAKLPPIRELTPKEEERFKKIYKLYNISFRFGGHYRLSKEELKCLFAEMPDYVEKKVNFAFRDPEFVKAWREQEALERRARMHVVE